MMHDEVGEMSPEAMRLVNHIQLLIGSGDTAKDWTNTLSYSTKVSKADWESAVHHLFGGLNTYADFVNGVTQYKYKAMPVQNKHTRKEKAYQTYDGNENKGNILAYPKAGGPAVFNLHVPVRIHKAKKKAIEDGWTTM